MRRPAQCRASRRRRRVHGGARGIGEAHGPRRAAGSAGNPASARWERVTRHEARVATCSNLVTSCSNCWRRTIVRVGSRRGFGGWPKLAFRCGLSHRRGRGEIMRLTKGASRIFDRRLPNAAGLTQTSFRWPLLAIALRHRLSCPRVRSANDCSASGDEPWQSSRMANGSLAALARCSNASRDCAKPRGRRQGRQAMWAPRSTR